MRVGIIQAELSPTLAVGLARTNALTRETAADGSRRSASRTLSNRLHREVVVVVPCARPILHFTVAVGLTINQAQAKLTVGGEALNR